MNGTSEVHVMIHCLNETGHLDGGDYFLLWNVSAHTAVMFSDVQLHCHAGKNKRKPDQATRIFIHSTSFLPAFFLAPWLSTDRDLRLSDVATPPSCHEFATCQHNIRVKLGPRTVTTLLSLHPGHQRECPEFYSEGSSQKGRAWWIYLQSLTQFLGLSAR